LASVSVPTSWDGWDRPPVCEHRSGIIRAAWHQPGPDLRSLGEGGREGVSSSTGGTHLFAPKVQCDNSPGQRPGLMQRGMRKPERLRDNSPLTLFWGTTSADLSAFLGTLGAGFRVARQKGIPFRAALQAASLSVSYPQGAALGCYRGAPSARWCLAESDSCATNGSSV